MKPSTPHGFLSHVQTIAVSDPAIIDATTPAALAPFQYSPNSSGQRVVLAMTAHANPGEDENERGGTQRDRESDEPHGAAHDAVGEDLLRVRELSMEAVLVDVADERARDDYEHAGEGGHAGRDDPGEKHGGSPGRENERDELGIARSGCSRFGRRTRVSAPTR